MPAEAMPRDAERLRDLLEHPDPPSLWYQLGEIVDGGIYTREGVSAGPGDVVLDIGANVGVAAAYFADVCGAERVHCFEPIPATFALLRRNVAQFPSCAAHEVGIAASSGTAALTHYTRAGDMSGLYADPDEDRELVRRVLVNRGVPDAEARAGLRDRFEAQTVECRMRTLSDAITELGVERVDLLKIDVEKAELDVLAGIQPGDWPRIRQIAMESHDAGGRAATAASTLRQQGFTVTFGRDSGLSGTGLCMVYATRT